MIRLSALLLLLVSWASSSAHAQWSEVDAREDSDHRLGSFMFQLSVPMLAELSTPRLPALDPPSQHFGLARVAARMAYQFDNGLVLSGGVEGSFWSGTSTLGTFGIGYRSVLFDRDDDTHFISRRLVGEVSLVGLLGEASSVQTFPNTNTGWGIRWSDTYDVGTPKALFGGIALQTELQFAIGRFLAFSVGGEARLWSVQGYEGLGFSVGPRLGFSFLP